MTQFFLADLILIGSLFTVDAFIGIKHNNNVLYEAERLSQLKREIDPTLVYYWLTLYDVGPTVNQCWANVS